MYQLEKKNNIEYYTLLNLRKVQLLQLELLKVIDKVAKENNIDYWIDGGTLLGAVRHGGFIPWDDDVDVCLLKKDYDKLIPLLDDYIKAEKDYGLMYYGSGIKYWSEYFINKKVITEHEGIKKNLRVDIIPLKLTKNDKDEIGKDKFFVDTAGYLVYGRAKYFSEISNKYKFKSLDEALSVKKDFFNDFVDNYLNKNFDVENYDNMLLNYAFNDLAVSREREYYNYSEIFPLKEVKFEGYSFPAPNNIDSYLRKLYRDYMELPKLENRKPMNEKYIFTNHTDDSINTKYIEYWNRYFYNREKKLFKLQTLLKQVFSNGLLYSYKNTISPFIKRGFKFK